MTKELFPVQTDPLHDWGALVREIEQFKPSLLSLWKEEYDRWKHKYQRFRDAEEHSFFTADESGHAKRLDENTLRFHRMAVFALLSSAEKCREHLNALPLEGEDAQERLTLAKRASVLIEGLRETLEVWHPVNVERITELKLHAS